MKLSEIVKVLEEYDQASATIEQFREYCTCKYIIRREGQAPVVKVLKHDTIILDIGLSPEKITIYHKEGKGYGHYINYYDRRVTNEAQQDQSANR